MAEAPGFWPTALPSRATRTRTLLGGRYLLPKGTMATVLLPMLHRDPPLGSRP
ncbi:MAG: hypothetical protein U0893_24045 [Chloroflexota bacterium]